MSGATVVTVGAAITALEAAGFVFKRMKGDHRMFHHDDGRRCLVAGGRDKDEIPRGTLGRMKRAAGIRFGIYLLAGTYFGMQAILSGGINDTEGAQFAGLNKGPSVT